MKKLLLLFVFILSSCTDKKESLIRQNETINIIETLLKQKDSEVITYYQNEDQLPICLNLKKILVSNKCFIETKPDNKIIFVKFPKKSFTNTGEVCIEKIYKSMPIENSFFLRKDSLDIINQNTTFKTFKIAKSITGNFKTLEQTKNLKTTKKFIQFSIPIFSKDNTKAYLEYDHYSDNENSYGNSIYLEKIKGKWKIKSIERNWAI